MFDWLRGEAGIDADRQSRLGALLADYPPLTPRHLGTNGSLPRSTGSVLTLEQCRENLHRQIAATPRRLQLLGALLGNFGLRTDAAYDAGERERFLVNLDAMLVAELPSLWRKELTDAVVFELSDRAGPRIVHSLVGDLALLTGDVMLRAKPGCFWGMDLDRRDRTMIAYRRPCLLGLSDGMFPAVDHIYHLEAEWFGVYASMDAVYPGRFGRFIGHQLIDRLERDVVKDDLPARRTQGWLKQAV